MRTALLMLLATLAIPHSAYSHKQKYHIKKPKSSKSVLKKDDVFERQEVHQNITKNHKVGEQNQKSPPPNTQIPDGLGELLFAMTIAVPATLYGLSSSND
ncbi:MULTISPECIES: hypothetical protein [unclassified Picosynechococcus]|uniref:hypothetical protein n=1 Tax=unclassified Picosynechococcus TaxID=3079910 RepID=UPI0010FBE032|nr:MULTISPECIES: hypothetical protein [unclassified Picosynechococcus]QCS48042.1 hypothetical protein FEK30_00510 [Picosynechococcus sp. PCC 11901]QCS48080.1 hypothetical protein FEK30_00745 [Picosynechococcus sp. PCC 11901]